MIDRLRVLVIEDDEVLQSFLVELLTDAGYDVYTALHDDDVRAIASEVELALVLICGSKRGTFAAGWRVAQTLHEAIPRLPLLMLSTNPDALAEVGKTKRGKMFVAGLPKPFQVESLLTTITWWS